MPNFTSEFGSNCSLFFINDEDIKGERQKIQQFDNKKSSMTCTNGGIDYKLKCQM